MFRKIKDLPLLILLLMFLIVGFAALTHYGESWDELNFFKYADRALQAYSTWPRSGEVPLTGNTYDNYGPAYVMIVALGARLLGLILPYTTSDLRHLIYFITYLVGLWAFYSLGKRWLTQIAAFGATVLLATQPLFWGHAFISPKDIPFLTFFLLSLLFGFRMADSVKSVSFETVTPRLKRVLLVLTTLWLASVFGLVAATPLFRLWIESLVRAAAAGQTNIVSAIASDIHKVKPEIYIQKYFVYFLWARAAFFLLTTFVIIWLWRKVPSAYHFLFAVAPAAILLGITTSIRVLGPLAGLLVIGYALWKSGKQTVPSLIAYILIALIAMYLTWPYLWPDPIGHLVESVRVMSVYPWRGVVLFNGVEYPSTGLPASYLPVLLALQLTEPVWVLFALGLAITIFGLRPAVSHPVRAGSPPGRHLPRTAGARDGRRAAAARGTPVPATQVQANGERVEGSVKKQVESRVLLTLTLIWFLLPLLGFILSHSALYDNFRQILFILPPVFFMAGAAFEKIKRPVLQMALIGLLALPGIVDSARLHPYEYIYYNRFIGGVQGAFRKYELDYWGTSYREAAGWLNVHAAANSTVWVEGPAHLIGLYLRPDLKLYSTYEIERADHYDYVVALTRYNLDLQSYPEAKIVRVIERDGALLTVIKKP
jgi:hypothetical protein